MNNYVDEFMLTNGLKKNKYFLVDSGIKQIYKIVKDPCTKSYRLENSCGYQYADLFIQLLSGKVKVLKNLEEEGIKSMRRKLISQCSNFNTFYGEVGEDTAVEYADGSKAKVGDLVQITSDGSSHDPNFVVKERNGYSFVMGLGSTKFSKGESLSGFSITKYKDYFSVETGTIDSCQVKMLPFEDAKKQEIKIEEGLWIYFLVLPSGFDIHSKELSREMLERDVKSGMMVFTEDMFSKAKMVNKQSGQVIDLLQ